MFSFFRRHQKMVIIVMALLMVGFLVGAQGFQCLTRTDPGKVALLLTKYKDDPLTYNDRQAAETDIAILGQLGINIRQVVLDPKEENVTRGYALLLKEAAHSDIYVTPADVTASFEHLGLEVTGEKYAAKISNIRAGKERRIPEKRIRQAMQRYLAVDKTFQRARVDVPPSDRQVRGLYRDLMEKINLRVVRFDAEKLAEEVKDEDLKPEELGRHFNKYRSIAPGIRPQPAVGDMGFGYPQPPRVGVGYLWVRKDALARVVEPKNIGEYWEKNKAKFLKQVPVESPATRPATGPATQPATGNVLYHVKEKTLYEATPEIRKLLMPQAVDRAVSDLLTRAMTVLQQVRDAKLAGDPFQHVRKRMTRSADTHLARKITLALPADTTLEQAVNALSDLAGVRICFPWGTHGERSWDKDLKVSLNVRDMSLGDVLRGLTAQIKDMPPLSWATCDGVDRMMIFPVSGVDMFPLQAGRTPGPMTREDLEADALLGDCSTAPQRGRKLLDIAFQAKGVAPAGRERIAPGDFGPEMHVMSPQGGRVLWQLQSAQGPRPLPEAPTGGVPPASVMEQVRKDLKIAKAMKLAKKRASELFEAAKSDGLQAAADVKKLESFETGLFQRKELGLSPFARQQAMWLLGKGLYEELQKIKPDQVYLARVQSIDLATPKLNEHFKKAAFALAPENVDPPYPEKPYALAVITLWGNHEVLLVQRVEYLPVVKSEFEGPGRAEAILFLVQDRRRRERARWFTYKAIVARLEATEVLK